MSTLKHARSFHAKVLTSTTAKSVDNAPANPNTLESKESAATALQDTTMIATPINAFANQDSDLLEDSVNLSALLTRPTSMENANATMDFLFPTENASTLDLALLTATLMTTATAAFAAQDSQSLMENAPATNTVERTAILDMDNAIARRVTSGSSEPAGPAVPMKPSTV